VLIIERWLLGRLRHRRFYSRAELNAAIREFLEQLNEKRPIRRLGVTRRALLEELDRPHLKPLPVEPYDYAEWRLRRVDVDYHVEVEAHFYSVLYRFDRRAARSADPPRPHPRNERRQLSPQAEQATPASDVKPGWRSACHGAHCGEGPVLAMLPRIKSGVRVAPRLPSPTLRAMARKLPGRDGKAGSLIKLES
jgi:Mu transposase-like protein